MLADLLRKATEHARTDATDWRTRLHALIEQIATENNTSGWDGYGAQPIAAAAKNHAQMPVELLHII